MDYEHSIIDWKKSHRVFTDKNDYYPKSEHCIIDEFESNEQKKIAKKHILKIINEFSEDFESDKVRGGGWCTEILKTKDGYAAVVINDRGNSNCIMYLYNSLSNKHHAGLAILLENRKTNNFLVILNNNGCPSIATRKYAVYRNKPHYSGICENPKCNFYLDLNPEIKDVFDGCKSYLEYVFDTMSTKENKEEISINIFVDGSYSPQKDIGVGAYIVLKSDIMKKISKLDIQDLKQILFKRIKHVTFEKSKGSTDVEQKILEIALSDVKKSKKMNDKIIYTDCQKTQSTDEYKVVHIKGHAKQDNRVGADKIFDVVDKFVRKKMREIVNCRK